MKVIQSRSFAKKGKKLDNREKTILDEQIKSIMENPGIGDEKKGDLRGIFIHKLKTIQYLLSCRIVEDTLELIMLGPCENYYRDLKKIIVNSTCFHVFPHFCHKT